MLGARVNRRRWLTPTSIDIHPFADEAIGAMGRDIQGNNPASTAWPAANRALGFWFTLEQQTTFACFFVANGATVSGNFDISVYNESFAELFSTGSTAQSGTSANQSVAQTFTLPPGLYYCNLAFDNTTATVQAKTAAAAATPASHGFVQMSSAFPLPSTFVPELYGTTTVPLFGISQKASV